MRREDDALFVLFRLQFLCIYKQKPLLLKVFILLQGTLTTLNYSIVFIGERYEIV